MIDDEPQVSGFIAQGLRIEGWNVSEIRSVEQVFEMLSEGKWLLVFCDVVLGEAEIRNLPMTDDLTDLYKRRGFFILTEQQQKMA